jgi:drug/metabolite transporter (DMT)-like permease
MTAASLSFAVMGAMVKWSAAGVSFFTTVFVRSAIVALVSFAVCRWRHAPLRVHNRRLLWWRTGTGFSAMTLYFYALSELPLANALTIQYTSPLFVAFLSRRMVGERVGLWGVALIWLAFVGAALILGPDLTALNPGAAAALASAVLAALAYLAVRSLGASDRPETVVFEFAIWSTVASLPGAIGLIELESVQALLATVGAGVAASMGQLGMTAAYRHADAAFVSALSYSTVLFGAALGILVLAEPFTWHAAGGAALVVAAGTALSLIRPPPRPTVAGTGRVGKPTLPP